MNNEKDDKFKKLTEQFTHFQSNLCEIYPDMQKIPVKITVNI